MQHQPLQKLLQQGLAWRGWQSETTANKGNMVLDTGYDSLNAQLHGNGWPQGGLIEVFGSIHHHLECLLYFHALRTLFEHKPGGHAVLINPPFQPLAETWLRQNLPLNRIVIINSQKPDDALMSFRELANAKSCIAILFWCPHLNYAASRQCQLAVQNQAGLYVTFKPDIQSSQASPSALKLKVDMTASHCDIQILKQRGHLQTSTAAELKLPLPDLWRSSTPMDFCAPAPKEKRATQYGTVVKHSF